MNEREFKYLYSNLSLDANELKSKLSLLGVNVDLQFIEKMSVLKAKGYSVSKAMQVAASKDSGGIVALTSSNGKTAKVATNAAKKNIEKKLSPVKKEVVPPQSTMQTQVDGDVPQRIVEYRILSSTDVFDLQQQVNSAIKSGWMPMGGVCVYLPGVSFVVAQDSCFQAIVKMS